MIFRRIVILILIVQSCFSIAYSQSSDVDILRKNLYNDAVIALGFTPRTNRYISSDYSKAGEYLHTMNADGSWSDVDYEDRDNRWDPLKHLDKMLVMSIEYSSESSELFQNEDVLEGLERALQFWYTKNPVCDNWYKNRIAKQFYFNVIGILLQGKIDDALLSIIVNDLTENPTMTGSNRTLLAISTFYRGVLEQDPEMIKLGVDGVTDQIVVSDKEGIQADYSFHQHGHFLYNGSYGSNFLRESIWMATMVHGTDFAFSQEQIGILRNYLLEGTRWMVRGELFDYNVRGRRVGRPGGFIPDARSLIPQLGHFMIADPEYKQEYEAAKLNIEKNTPLVMDGNRHFWRSDYTAHHRTDYFTSLKMCSKRTVGIELNMNSENKLGYWLPYGLTYIYRRGDEYSNIFPVWDWALLPGVTNPHLEIEEFGKGVAHTQKTNFVGGVSDGKYGVSAMQLSKQNTEAKKAWFWFDDEWVGLGAGIESSSEEEIVTGINQTLRNGEILVDGHSFAQGTQSLQHPNWVLHDSIAYVFPGEQTIHIKADIQKGNLQRIYGLGQDSVYASEVFSLWFDHGKKPKNEKYEYIVVPGTSVKEMEKYANNSPIYILSNTKNIQAVRHNNLELTGIVFHQAGELLLNGDLTIAVKQACLVLVNQKTGELWISDPTAELEEVTIQIDWKGKKSQTVKLPSGGLAGKSVLVDIL